MKVLAVTVVCLVAITTTHGFGIGFPPFRGIGMHPIGLGMHPFGMGMPPFGMGMPPFGLGMSPFGHGIPHLGLGIPPVGFGIPTAGLGVSPLAVGNTGSVNQGLVQTGKQGVRAIGSNGHGFDNVDLDAYVPASYATAAPTTIAASAVAPAGHAAYEPVYIAV